MDKYAFFTMDVESFFDTCCIKRLNLKPNGEQAGAEGIEKYLNLLDKYGIKSTLFVTTQSLKFTLPYLKKAKERGHKLAFHSTEHIEPTQLTEEEFEGQIVSGLKEMKREFGEMPSGYRAPCFKLDNARLEIVQKYFTYDSSNLAFEKACPSCIFSLDKFEREADNIYKRGNFYEFRPCVGKLLWSKIPLSGGGYVRLLPWFIIGRGVKKYIKTHNSYLFYVHPFELVDKREDCTKMLSLKDKLYIKIGRKTYLKKIEKIIKYLKNAGYVFLTPDEYIKMVDSNNER